MAVSRKDPKGRKLRDGESWRSDHRYSYRYTDARTGKRHTIYAAELPELREKEKQLAQDLDENILCDTAVKKMTLNDLFARYIEIREIGDTTKSNYMKTWNNRVRDDIGQMKVVMILPSHIKAFYAKLSKAGYAHATIKYIDNIISPALEMAVDDDIIRKNPAKGALKDQGKAAEKKEALTRIQQEKFLAFAKESNVYCTYYPMLVIMLGTGLRCGELIGLTWNDIDMKARTLTVDHQLVYKNLGDGCNFHIYSPKTDAGVRVIPMMKAVQKAFEEQRKINFMLAQDKSVEVDGYSGFIFTAKSGKPMMPSAVNNILYNIVAAYNKRELQRTKKEHRKAELLPKFSSHVMRHTACTRMAESRMDIKVLQYIMGHAHIDVTMDVYNHLGDRSRIEKEVSWLDDMAINF